MYRRVYKHIFGVTKLGRNPMIGGGYVGSSIYYRYEMETNKTYTKWRICEYADRKGTERQIVEINITEEELFKRKLADKL